MLDGLLQGAIEDALLRSESVPLERVKALAAGQKDALDVYEILRQNSAPKIIAEIKRSSPSRGKIAEIADPVSLARKYESGGASVISVLTEGRKFGGSLDDLRAVKEAVHLPILRKDFIGDEYQVYEARAFGADMILLILASLDDETAKQLYDLAHDLGMAVLVEVHDSEELQRANALEAQLIGINARDLKTFNLDRQNFKRLAPLVNVGAIKVAESAVFEKAHFDEYIEAGADVVLIGEALVTHGDPEGTLRNFLEG